MLHIRLEAGFPVEVTSDFPKDGTWCSKGGVDGWINRNDIKSFAYAQTLAQILTEKFGTIYLATDAGESTSPRYDVQEAPKVGDKVSKSFNGDSYPCGTIVKITPTWQITTDTGAKFRRYKESGAWRQTGRGFWMISGHHDERNPSF